MTNTILRGVVAAALAALAPLASAHEFTCSARAGLLTVGQDGGALTTADGMPVPLGTLQSAFTVSSYPATIGVEVTLRNVASEPSVLTGSWDTLDSTGGAPAQQFPLPPIGAGQMAPPFAAGTTLPVGGSIVGWFAYRVMNQQECLHAFGGQAGAPVCTSDETDFRFVAWHDVGSTECRARIVCGSPEAQPPAAGPVPPPECPATWHGVRQFGRSASTDVAAAIALGPDCTVSVLGSDVSQLAPWDPQAEPPDLFLETFDASGAPLDVERWGHAGTARATLAGGVAVDLAGSRWASWSEWAGVRIGKFPPLGVALWTEPPGPITAGIGGVAADTAGNGYAVGQSFGTHEQFQVVKFAPDGAVIWSQVVPGLGMAAGGFRGALALDAAGHVLVAGTTAPATYNGTPTTAFVAELDGASGNVLWTTLFPGPGNGTEATSIAVDADGNAFVAVGLPGAPLATFSIAKLDPQGNVLWTRPIASPSGASVSALATDPSGNVWAAGLWFPTPPGPAAEPLDAFVAKLDPSGILVFLKPFGTPAADVANAIAVDANGDAFVAGETGGDLGGTPDGMDAFVAKFDPLGNLQ